eukprot:2663088-Rhodomonas_salina.2
MASPGGRDCHRHRAVTATGSQAATAVPLRLSVSLSDPLRHQTLPPHRDTGKPFWTTDDAAGGGILTRTSGAGSCCEVGYGEFQQAHRIRLAAAAPVSGGRRTELLAGSVCAGGVLGANIENLRLAENVRLAKNVRLAENLRLLNDRLAENVRLAHRGEADADAMQCAWLQWHTRTWIAELLSGCVGTL